MFHGKIPLKSVLLLLLVYFVSGFRLKLMYISLIVSVRSSLTWFIEITFFICTNRINLESKGKFNQASYHCKMVLEAGKLADANKTKESITS